MRYLGGKARIGRKIATYLQSIQGEREYLEPFVGGANVLQHIKGGRQAFDINESLILLYKSLQAGWDPPTEITEDEYKDARRLEPCALKAFVGIGCSFGGKWFGGYAREGDRNFAANCRGSLLKMLPLIADVEFEWADYSILHPVGRLVYCDPPYEGTTRYDVLTGRFDHRKFWEIMREWSRNDDNLVVISEYKCPMDFRCVLEIPTKLDMNSNNGRELRMERLFMYDGS